nr:prepilin-type N-terminal cleavage/methylation domain-containing protein [Thioalkalivibrio sp. ALRh]
MCPLLTPARKRHEGFTLVELMIGILVGTIVVAGTIALYITVIRGAAFVTQEARLAQETRIAMDLMANDIRRAGYSHPARITPPNDDEPAKNPFMGEDLNITVHGDTCILLAYDPTFAYDIETADFDAPPPSQYVFGYRLENETIQMLTSSINSTQDCSTGTWEDLTDPATTRVGRLEFDTSPTRCMKIADDGSETFADTCDQLNAQPGDIFAESRRIRITMEASHTSSPDSRIDFEETISVRNQRIFAPN